MVERIDSLSHRAEQMEQLISDGSGSDAANYDEVVRHHNLLIDSVTAATQRYEVTYSRYERLHDSVSALIARYNTLVGK